MITVSETQNNAPKKFKTELQEKAYKALVQLQLPYGRFDTDEVIGTGRNETLVF